MPVHSSRHRSRAVASDPVDAPLAGELADSGLGFPDGYARQGRGCVPVSGQESIRGRGMNIGEIARRAGVSRSTVSYVLSGKRTSRRGPGSGSRRSSTSWTTDRTPAPARSRRDAPAPSGW
ncbi:LacI family DNA-binding transcriptional regulator [Micromonospora sp. NPDC049801]|uniref:LacI family DNA-binding transcriptional regulator n=1 Tax=Micromonospora TaxID=1873 RepID=UPI0033F57B4F